MTVSRRLRFEILRRDDYTCRYCGAKAPDAELAIDHVIPITLGGGDEPTNLVTACVDCNSGKSSIQPDSRVVDEVDAFAMLFVRAVEKATDIRQKELGDMRAAIAAFDEVWCNWWYGSPPKDIPRDAGWPDSIQRFLALGLQLPEVLQFAENALNSKSAIDKTWKRFCWLCWNEIKTRQEMARQLIEDGQV